jgi:hypothetical protein
MTTAHVHLGVSAGSSLMRDFEGRTCLGSSPGPQTLWVLLSQAVDRDRNGAVQRLGGRIER